MAKKRTPRIREDKQKACLLNLTNQLKVTDKEAQRIWRNIVAEYHKNPELQAITQEEALELLQKDYMGEWKRKKTNEKQSLEKYEWLKGERDNPSGKLYEKATDDTATKKKKSERIDKFIEGFKKYGRDIIDVLGIKLKDKNIRILDTAIAGPHGANVGAKWNGHYIAGDVRHLRNVERATFHNVFKGKPINLNELNLIPEIKEHIKKISLKLEYDTSKLSPQHKELVDCYKKYVSTIDDYNNKVLQSLGQIPVDRFKKNTVHLGHQTPDALKKYTYTDSVTGKKLEGKDAWVEARLEDGKWDDLDLTDIKKKEEGALATREQARTRYGELYDILIDDAVDDIHVDSHTLRRDAANEISFKDERLKNLYIEQLMGDRNPLDLKFKEWVYDWGRIAEVQTFGPRSHEVFNKLISEIKDKRKQADMVAYFQQEKRGGHSLYGEPSLIGKAVKHAGIMVDNALLSQAFISTVQDTSHFLSNMRSYFGIDRLTATELTADAVKLTAHYIKTPKDKLIAQNTFQIYLMDKVSNFAASPTDQPIWRNFSSKSREEKAMGFYTAFRDLHVKLLDGVSSAERTAALFISSAEFAKLKGISFDKLTPEVKDTFNTWGISERDWDVVKKYGLHEINKTPIISTEMFSRADDYLENRAMYRDLAAKWNIGMEDMVNTLIPTPAARQRKYKIHDSNTFTGALIHMVHKLKSFTDVGIITLIRASTQGKGGKDKLIDALLPVTISFGIGIVVQAIQDAMNGYDRDWGRSDAYVPLLARSGMFGHIGSIFANAYGNPRFSSLPEYILGPQAAILGDLTTSVAHIPRLDLGPAGETLERWTPTPPIVGNLMKKEFFKLLRAWKQGL